MRICAEMPRSGRPISPGSLLRFRFRGWCLAGFRLKTRQIEVERGRVITTVCALVRRVLEGGFPGLLTRSGHGGFTDVQPQSVCRDK